MTVLQIPIASVEPHFVQENDAFGQSFILEFEWIDSENFWMIHVFDDDRSPLALGIRVQSDWPLYIYHLKSGFIVFMLVATSLGQVLSRNTLKQYFTLVAYDAF